MFLSVQKSKRIHHDPQYLIILHILEFRKSYLRKLDTDDALISEAYYTSIRFAGNLKSEFKTTFLNKSLNGLEEVEHGNAFMRFLIKHILDYITSRPKGSSHSRSC